MGRVRCAHGDTATRYASGRCRLCAAKCSDAWRRAHPELYREATRRWARKNPERVKAQKRLWNQTEKAKESQRRRSRRAKGLPLPTRPCPAVCECCGRSSDKLALALDHEHDTNRFRGWLCGQCNTAIGSLGDDIAGVKRALAYLERVKETYALQAEQAGPRSSP